MSTKLWLDAGQIKAGAEGGTVQTFPDKSGYGRAFTQSTLADRGAYRSRGVAGLPGVAFDGFRVYYNGQGMLSQYIGATQFAILGAAKIYEGSDNATVFLNDAILAFTGGFFSVTFRPTALYGYISDGADKSTSRTIASGSVVVFSLRWTGGNMDLSVNGGPYSTPVAAGAPSDLTGVPRIGVDYSSTYFAQMILAELKVRDDYAADHETEYLSWVRRYATSPTVYLDAQDRGARELRKLRAPRSVISVPVPFWYGLGLELGAPIWLQHPELAHAAGSGALAKPWDLWRGVLVRRVTDLSGNQVILTVNEALRMSLWFVPSGVLEPTTGSGVVLLLSGQTVSHTRASVVYVRHPGGNLVELPIDIPGWDKDGLLCESASTNLFLNAYFAGGLTGWTSAGAGTTPLSTTDLLFDGSVTPNSAMLTADNPLVSGRTIAQTVAVLANDPLTFSLYHADLSSVKLTWQAQRSIDSQYYNATTDAWGGAVANDIAVSTTKTRVSELITTVGGSNTNVTITVKAVTNAAQVNALYHLQIEKKRWASSVIGSPSTSLTYTRAATAYRIPNNSSAPSWCPSHGSGFIGVKCNFNSADIGSAKFTVLRVRHDANNIWLIEYDGATGRFNFKMTYGGTTKTAYVTQSVTKDTLYLLGFRWIGADGELSLTPYTIDLFCNGTQGTSDVGAALPTPVATCNIELGDDGTNWLEGVVTRFTLTPDVLTNARMIAGVD